MEHHTALVVGTHENIALTMKAIRDAVPYINAQAGVSRSGQALVDYYEHSIVDELWFQGTDSSEPSPTSSKRGNVARSVLRIALAVAGIVAVVVIVVLAYAWDRFQRAGASSPNRMSCCCARPRCTGSRAARECRGDMQSSYPTK